MTDTTSHTAVNTNFPPSDWMETTLGKIIEISSGKVRPKNKGDFPVYGGNGILDYADDFNFENESIIVGRVGAYCGATYFETNKFRLSDNALGIKANEKSDIKFLYYFLINQNLNKKAIGGAQPLLTQGILNQIEIILPPLSEQVAIATLLSSFDNKIELLKEENKTLEQTAQTIFQEWFGKYSVDSELPEGWRVGKLSEIAEFLNGVALQKFPPENENDYLPVVKIRELKAGITEQTDKASKNIDPKYIVDDGDVLFSWSGSLELVIWKYGKGALNQHLFKVSSQKYPKWFYYFWTLYHLEDFRSIASNKATTMGHIQRHHLDQAQVIIPDNETLQKLDQQISPILEKIMLINQEIQSLARNRDGLLPRLMRGEVRVEI